MVHLFGPLPPIYRTGKFWSDEYIPGPFTHNGTLLAQRLDNEGVDSELSEFIMGMLNLDPEKRISARDALRHEWLVGPLMGYWAVLGMEWKAADARESEWQRPADTAKREIVELRTLTPEISESLIAEKKGPSQIYDFSTLEEENDDEEVSFVCAGSSPTKPIPFNEPPIPMEPEEHVLDLRDGANVRMMMMKYYYCKYVELL
jgi:serine/threonine protein kinase